MTRTRKALCCVLAAAMACSAQTDFDWTSIKPSTVLKWKSCYDKGFECARLTVPLDYANPKSTKTAAIAVTRFLSTSSPSKYRGPILINPGGPAGSGVEWVLEVGQQLATVVGPEYDIVGFDPRGTSFSTPLVSWFADDSERATWLPPSENTVYQSVNQSTDSLAHLYARAQIQAALAAARNTDGYLQFITTDYTAQDMLTITEAFGFKKLQYWGISYGSVIGATFAAKFPDKVERLIIDGVVPLEAWYTANMTNTVQDADKALGIFVSACFAAGPSLCAFHNNATSAADIASSLQTLLLSIQQTPVPAIIAPISGSLSYGVVDYTFVKNVILDTLYES
ncbi:hypothetical protein C8F01DRAFT_1084781 [Mycena amicta]|nr:hypothetical protein C8F01DRAFT_1084781 [Mycena amicta]